MSDRVTAHQLFQLASMISGLARSAHRESQAQVVTNLNGALAVVLEAAKSAAFNEAHAAYNLTEEQ